MEYLTNQLIKFNRPEIGDKSLKYQIYVECENCIEYLLFISFI